MKPGDVFTLSISLIFAMLMLSLVVLTGWAGQISLGQLAIAAIGAAVGRVVGLPGQGLLRVPSAVGWPRRDGDRGRPRHARPADPGPVPRGHHLAFALATGTYFLNREFFPWLVPDPNRVLRPAGDLRQVRPRVAAHLLLRVPGVRWPSPIASVAKLQRSRTGRVLVANRDNTRAAQSYGIEPGAGPAHRLRPLGLHRRHGRRPLRVRVQGPVDHHRHARVQRAAAGHRRHRRARIGAGCPPRRRVPGRGPVLQPHPDPGGQVLRHGRRAAGGAAGAPGGLGGLLYDTRDRLLRRLATAKRHRRAQPAGRRPRRRGRHRRRSSEPREVSGALGRPAALVRDLEVSYGRTQVLFGVDFHVERGEMVALLGTNGAGKSTLLSAIAGLARPARAARSLFDGERHHRATTPPTTVASGHRPHARRQGRVPHAHRRGEPPAGRVAASPRTPSTWQRATEEVLEHFPVLRERWDQQAGNLSGGEQQMLTLGQALICRPRLLMIDELSLGLAPIIVEQLLGIVRAIHANGHHRRARRAVGERGHHAGRAGRVPREGRGPLRRSHRRSARPARDPAGRVPRRAPARPSRRRGQAGVQRTSALRGARASTAATSTALAARAAGALDRLRWRAGRRRRRPRRARRPGRRDDRAQRSRARPPSSTSSRGSSRPPPARCCWRART